jgi:hypothetical protein
VGDAGGVFHVKGILLARVRQTRAAATTLFAPHRNAPIAVYQNESAHGVAEILFWPSGSRPSRR